MKWLTAMTAVLGLGFCLSLQAQTSASKPAGNDDWDAVVAAARKEGQVVLYTANVGVRFHHEIAALFEKRYGIPVTILEARASEIRERIRTEQASGRAIADVSHNGATTTSLQAREGVFRPYGTLPATGKLAADFKPDELRVPIFAITYGMLVNTRSVPPEAEPRSWKDLLDPRWQGKILSDDYRALGGGSVFFFVTHDAFGREFHESLSRQKPVFTRDIRDAERRVARGEYAVLSPFILANMLQLRGLPVKPIVPSEGATYIPYQVAMLKDAPHPNAARLLMNFFIEHEAQAIYAKGGYVPALSEATREAPPDLRSLLEARLLGTTDASRQDAMLQAAKTLYP